MKIIKVLPKVYKGENKVIGDFPVDHFSASMLILAATNPIMFKIRYINGDIIDTTTSASAVLGSAVHRGIQAYLGGEKDIATPADEGEAIKHGHMRGLEYLTSYSDGFINYSSTIPNRQKLEEKYAFSYFGYIKEFNYKDRCKELILVEEKLKYKVEVEGQKLPIPLTSVPDWVLRDMKDRICIEDHKVVYAYSKEDEIDATKIIQAVFNYFTVYAHTGEAPYKFTFREFKHSLNSDGSPQTREYSFIYSEVPMMFELFYRLYQDVTDMLLGKAVYIPNFRTMWDKEVSILSYIYRLDVQEERNQAFKKMKVDNITDFLKQKIQKEGSIKKYMEQVATQFISAKTLNYKDMQIEERIKMKLAEHGLGLDFHSKIEGDSVTMYRYEPSIGLKMKKIEAYVKDIEQVVEVSGVRALCPIPNSGLVGFEVPKIERSFPVLKIAKKTTFELSIGRTIMGETRVYDIREAPHILVAGSAGSGKSVFLNNLIKQLLLNKEAELYLFDPKQVELVEFEDEKNVKEYISDYEQIGVSLNSLIKEMENRYAIMKEKKVKNIRETDMKYKIVIIDEFADLIMNLDLGKLVQLLAQKGRACGIHLIIATQRASTKVISGDVKVNFGVKAVFRMSKAIDSRIMLDEDGAEKLLGKGDMLFSTEKGTERLQSFNLG